MSHFPLLLSKQLQENIHSFMNSSLIHMLQYHSQSLSASFTYWCYHLGDEKGISLWNLTYKFMSRIWWAEMLYKVKYVYLLLCSKHLWAVRASTCSSTVKSVANLLPYHLLQKSPNLSNANTQRSLITKSSSHSWCCWIICKKKKWTPSLYLFIKDFRHACVC